MSLIKRFLGGNISGISGFPGIFHSDICRKTLLRHAEYSQPRRENPPNAEIVLARKSKSS